MEVIITDKGNETGDNEKRLANGSKTNGALQKLLKSNLYGLAAWPMNKIKIE